MSTRGIEFRGIDYGFGVYLLETSWSLLPLSLQRLEGLERPGALRSALTVQRSGFRV